MAAHWLLTSAAAPGAKGMSRTSCNPPCRIAALLSSAGVEKRMSVSRKTPVMGFFFLLLEPSSAPVCSLLGSFYYPQL